ncbi:thioredoxin [Azoarcus indigens]|uniref:Thioredoxin 1 n=1 Tax=Azoarcus indigens TaxID=29545 RepID=A0A4R6EF49_9RHOO|nr:thioredoxin family protein [Azoarcus indigens]NMG63342.1 thioredoxin [Azoarcus indigens]TDN56894.1 thioredoxin 1 [Azoarcus indigens]
METQATSPEPTREELDAQAGTTLLEFGAAWCGFCRAAQPLIASALAHHPEVRHIKVEDGPGRRLGRSYRVKLWPTLVLLVDGQEAGRVLRPASPAELEALLAVQR